MVRQCRHGRYARASGAAFLFPFLLASLLAWGCGKAQPAAPPQEEVGEDGGGEAAPSGETVTLTLYFRYQTPDQEWLAPEDRTVSGVTDPYRTAVEELIRGPAPGSPLHPVLPDTVKVLGVDVAGGVCTLNVSKEILTDASLVGVGSTSEALALSAIADTLTEFGEIDRVKLLIEGMQSGMVEGRFVEDFWGHTGLPEYLERNEEILYGAP